MVTLPSNMFSSVTLPATLWFFDKTKKGTDKEDEILFVDARNVFTQVDRAHRKFSEEQIRNLAIITRLYEGDTDAFAELIAEYKAKLAEAPETSEDKNNGEDTIVFVTDDKTAFRNYKEELMDEFNKVTGKTIEIHPNSYYRELLIQLETPENKEKNKPVSKIEELPNLELLRREVEETVEALCGIECEDYFGEPQWNKTFTTSVLFDKDYAKDVFAGLHSDILSHIFESSVPASKILDLDGRIVDTDMEIPIKNLEKALSIYQHILNNYSQFNEQFFEAVAKILNRNYVEPSLLMDTNDVNLPF